MVYRLRKKELPTEAVPQTDVGLLTKISDFLSSILNAVSYIHDSTTSDFDGMEHIERGGLHVLKGKFAMNSTRLVSIPDPLSTQGFELLKISFLFQSTNLRNIEIDLQSVHRDTGNYIETLYTATANANISVVQTFGRDYQYAVASKISLSTSSGTSTETVFFIITLKEIMPGRTY